MYAKNKLFSFHNSPIMDGANEESRRNKMPKSQCFSPWFLFCRCLSKEKRGGLELSTDGEENEEIGLRSPSLNGGNQRQSSSPRVEIGGVPHVADASEQHAKGNRVNLAVGFVLFHLIASSKKELRKMIELRREMEALLHNSRNELETHKRELVYAQSDSNNNNACSTIEPYGSLFSDGNFSISNFPYENQSEINSTSHAKRTEGIDQLEAELESELELLQVRFGSSDYRRNQHPRIPVDNISSGHSSASYKEAVDDHEIDIREQYGVCPHELERRLHELIQSRQQKKIEDLESDLQRANKKLLEKEKEVSWWKDTARIFSRHVPEASRVSRLGQDSHQVD